MHSTDATTEKPKPAVSEDVRRMVKYMRSVALLNAYFGLVNISFYATHILSDSAVLTTGLVSLAMYALVCAKIRYINGAKSWIEVSVTAACGLYLPMFTLLLTVLTLSGILGAG